VPLAFRHAPSVAPSLEAVLRFAATAVLDFDSAETILRAAFNAAIVMLVGSVIAFVLAARHNSKTVVTRTFENAPVEQFAPMLLLRAGTSAVVLTWAYTALGFPLVVILILSGVVTEAVLGFTLIGFLMILSAGTWLPALVRCPKCTMRLILNTAGPRPFGEPTRNRSVLIIRIVRDQPFHCMHCGQRYTT
jgi:hypothetical protein